MDPDEPMCMDDFNYNTHFNRDPLFSEITTPARELGHRFSFLPPSLFLMFAFNRRKSSNLGVALTTQKFEGSGRCRVNALLRYQ